MKELAELSTLLDTARYLRVSVSELDRLIEEGSLAVVPPISEPMIHEADLVAFIEARRSHARRVEGSRPWSTRLREVFSRSGGK